jgi:hypothetical protein
MTTNEPVRPARRFPRRTDRRAPDRLPNIDMRTREGKLYRRAFKAALEEFPGVPADRVAQVARLRLLAAQEETAALAGKGSADAAIRVANVAVRAAKDLKDTVKGKPASGGDELAAYLAELADRQGADDVEAADDVEEAAS